MLEKIFSLNNDKIRNYVWAYFLFVAAINLGFKLIHIDFSSFWYDEIISVQSASLNFGHIKHVSEWDNNPPFYYYCLRVWILLFSDSEFNIRLLSAIFSSLAGGVLFVFCNKHFNKYTAIGASFLYLSSNMLFFHAHEARAYSLVLLLVLLSSFVFLDLKDKPNYRNMILLGLLNFLIIYTHYIAGLVLFFQFIFSLILFEKKAKKAFVLSCIIPILLALLRFTKKQILLIINFNSAEHKFWLGKSNIQYLIDVLSELMIDKLFIVPTILIILTSIFFLSRMKNKEINQTYAYCFIVGIGSVVVLFLLGIVTPIFLDRYLIFTIPFIAALLAFGLSLLNPKFIVMTLCCLIFGLSVFRIDYKTEKNMDYKNAMSFIKKIKSREDLIIVKTKDIKPLFCYYYDPAFFSEQKGELPIGEHIIFCNSWQEVSEDVRKYPRIIVIDSYKEYNPNEKDFVKHLLELKPVHSTSNYFKGIDIAIYK